MNRLPTLVQFYLSVFTLYKLIISFDCVETGLISPQLAQAASRLLLKGSRRWPAIRIKSKERALELLRRYVPGFDRQALHLGLDFRPSWSAGPNTYDESLKVGSWCGSVSKA